MAPAWLRNPLAIFGAGVLAVALSVVVLVVVDGDAEEATLIDDGDLLLDVFPAPEAMASPRGGAMRNGVAAILAETSSRDESLGRVVVVTGPAFGQQTILWTEDHEGRNQALMPLENVKRGTLHAGDSVVMYAVLDMTPSGERELGIVYDATAFGSGSPTARFALLRLEDEEWRIVWDSGESEEWRGSHGTVEFPSRDLSELVVRSDSWSDGHDELSDVFHESNPGPHRYFVDQWVRDGDKYVREGADTVAAPYATFVEFVYALSTGDESSATDQVVDGDLVTVARNFGLDNAPGKHWLSMCQSGLVCGKEEPIIFYQGEPPVAVYFEERNGQWLISDIQPDRGSR